MCEARDAGCEDVYYRYGGGLYEVRAGGHNKRQMSGWT
jgi:hypothetical protein